MPARETLDVILISATVVGVIVTGLLVWKTKAAAVWRDVAEAREQKLDDQAGAIAELREEVAALRATIAYLEKRADEVVLTRLKEVERRAQVRHEAEMKVLTRLVERLEKWENT